MLAEHLQTLSSSAGVPSRAGRFLVGAAAVRWRACGGVFPGGRGRPEGPVQAQTPFAHTQVNPLLGLVTITPEGPGGRAFRPHGHGPGGSYHGLATLRGGRTRGGLGWQMRADGAWGNTKLFYGNLVVGRCHAGHRRFDRHLILVRPLPPGRRRGARDVDLRRHRAPWKVPKDRDHRDCGGIEHLEGAEGRDHR